MTPDALRAELFAAYPAIGRAFATKYLSLLRKLPLVVCPSFLREIQRLDTSFPAEGEALRLRCEFLLSLSTEEFSKRTETLLSLHVSQKLETMDWVAAPAQFIFDLTSFLWSSGQIDVFRSASLSLFAPGLSIDKDVSRLTVVLAGAGVSKPHGDLFRKLRARGLLLTGLDAATMPNQIEEVFNEHAGQAEKAYANWYIDGTNPLGMVLAPSTISVSYPQLEPLRLATLSHMDSFIRSKQGGAEDLRTSLNGITPHDIDAENVTPDPVLQRFYTELFTEGSGTQVFSTSFVQWTGRELARRARPVTLLLRYGPRQRQRSFDDLIRRAGEDTLDPDGALRDAEMGAYYNFLEMERITARGKGIFVLWIEGTTTAILVAPGAPVGARSDSPMGLRAALKNFS